MGNFAKYVWRAERVGRLALGHLLVQLRPHHHALLLVAIGPRPDEHCRRLATIDHHVGHPGREVQVVAGVGDVPMLQLLAGVHFHLFAAAHAERGLVLLVDMGLGPPACRRKRHGAEPESPGTDGLRAHPRRVVQSLLAPVEFTSPHHAPEVLGPRRFSHSRSSNRRSPVPSLAPREFVPTIAKSSERHLIHSAYIRGLFTGVLSRGILRTSRHFGFTPKWASFVWSTWPYRGRVKPQKMATWQMLSWLPGRRVRPTKSANSRDRS